MRRIFGGRSRRLGVDSADTSTVSDSDLDVTFFSPSRTPGVLDEEVIVAVFGTVTNGEDSMVELGSTGFGGDDTLLVSLEDGFVGLNSDRYRLLIKSGLELIRRIGGDIVEILDANNTVSGLVFASTEAVSLVRVFFFSLKRGGLSVSESKIHEASEAAVVAVLGTVDELLLREFDKLTIVDEVGSFHRSNSREGPA